MKRLLILVTLVTLLLSSPVQAGGRRVCKPIQHGTACYIGEQRVSVICKRGYELAPGYGTRCVKVRS